MTSLIMENKMKNTTDQKNNFIERCKDDLINTFLIRDIDDQIKNINQENWKTNIIFVVIATILSVVFDVLNKDCLSIVIFILILFVFLLGLFNIFSKKVNGHTKIDSLFIKGVSYGDWNNYLDNKFESLKYSYNEYTRLLNQKVIINKISFVILGLVILLTFIKYLII